MPRPDKWVKRWTSQSYSEDGPYTVALARDGSWGCDCARWRFAKAPKPDCKHIERQKRDLREPPLPWPGARGALQQLPKPPDREPPADLFLRALVDRAEREYVERGYMYSGCVHWRDVEEVCGRDWPDLDGYLVRRGCDGFALELPPERRLFLLHEHDLLDAWREKGSCFYYTAYGGEVFQVWRELTRWEFCPRCRRWQTPGGHDCRPEPWMMYLKEE